ncbi:hypothetical protein BZA05DRAFT_477190 [Tricharina praecox]|uniref:uncharacterized protein n=1 Tax=Tricharina praecox TaxID=43433 RepID=UPI00221E6AA3|nr:uncharacterized protein BZA05DRAFT_477190 [Tricharina praecox]KAI5843613.1 hypothetical protein BZA05DRAFT_477190 [Tricharina praecox]
MGKLACKLCSLHAVTMEGLMLHIASKSDHCSFDEDVCDCDGCNPLMSQYDDNDPRRRFSYKEDPPRSRDCALCGPVFCCTLAWKRLHTRDDPHKEFAELIGYYCSSSEKHFFTKASWEYHCETLHPSNVDYYCIDCDQEFPTQCALNYHPRNDAVHGKRVSTVSCEPCGQLFQTTGALEVHKKSKLHKKNTYTVVCLAFPKCQRKFLNKGSMLSHLESGGCASKTNRYKIDDVIRHHDTSSVVLKVQYSAPQSQQMRQSAISTPTGSCGEIRREYVALEPWDVDSDDELIIATPATCRSRRDSFSSDILPILVESLSELPTSNISGSSTPSATLSGPFTLDYSNFSTPSETIYGQSTSKSSGSLTPSATRSGRSTPQFSGYSTPRSGSGFSTPSATASGQSISDFPGIFTPPATEATSSSSGIWTPPGTLSGRYTPPLSGFSTPRSGSIYGGQSINELDFSICLGQVCHICHKKFPSPKALETHLMGLAHAPRIYKCPTSLFSLLGQGGENMRDFKSLSGLVMHLESGACNGGSERLSMAIAYVEEKLKGNGAGGVRLLM